MIECSATALLYNTSEVEEYFFRAARMLMQSDRLCGEFTKYSPTF
ncbi:hypothetical protein OSCI_1820007 [Kamptonema sp. PCC 6506]|nr:hypothetical protein OSCI_1820007 [Kamptonema sp. PCC 6506]